MTDPIIGISHHKAHDVTDDYEQVHIFEDNDTKEMWLIDGLVVRLDRDDAHVTDKHVQDIINDHAGHVFVVHERHDIDGCLTQTYSDDESKTLLNIEAKKSDIAPVDYSLVAIRDQLRHYDERIKAKYKDSIMTDKEERER